MWRDAKIAADITKVRIDKIDRERVRRRRTKHSPLGQKTMPALQCIHIAGIREDELARRSSH